LAHPFARANSELPVDIEDRRDKRRGTARPYKRCIENIGLFLTPPFIPADMNFYDDLTAVRFSYESVSRRAH